MNRAVVFSLLFGIIWGISPLKAQKRGDALKNRYITKEIKPDGDLSDWTDSLQNYQAAAKLHYDAGNDEENLYIAVKTSDLQTIRKILSFGFSFSVNTEAKKRSGPVVTFPVVDRIALRSEMEENARSKKRLDINTLNQQILSKTFGINVQGFKALLDGNIALNNEYGIKAGAALSDSGVFTYELVIPLKRLGLDVENKNELAYNFRVNGVQRTVIEQGLPSMGRYGMYGYGYGGYGYGYGRSEPYKRTISETVEFWVKYTLSHE